MEPTLMTGDVIIANPVDAEDIEKNDIIIYHGREGNLKGKIIVHRVIEEPVYENGKYSFKTQGDSNLIADPAVNEDMLIGKHVKVSAPLTFMFELFTSVWGYLIIAVILMIMFSGELIRFIKILSNRNSSDGEEPEKNLLNDTENNLLEDSENEP